MAQETVMNQKSIRRIEATDCLPESTVLARSRLNAALEAADIAFVGKPDNVPGICIRAMHRPKAD